MSILQLTVEILGRKCQRGVLLMFTCSIVGSFYLTGVAGFLGGAPDHTFLVHSRTASVSLLEDDSGGKASSSAI
jgi:hypothetical protein